MKKREEEITRVKSVIDKDRLHFNKVFNKLFGIDLNTLLEEYFILKNLWIDLFFHFFSLNIFLSSFFFINLCLYYFKGLTNLVIFLSILIPIPLILLEAMLSLHFFWAIKKHYFKK